MAINTSQDCKEMVEEEDGMTIVPFYKNFSSLHVKVKAFMGRLAGVLTNREHE
jgi:hypothetical protein